MKDNIILKNTQKIGDDAKSLAGRVGRGIKWVDDKVSRFADGVSHVGHYCSELGSDIISMSDEGWDGALWLIGAIPLKVVGWTLQASGLATKGIFKGSLKSLELIGRCAEAAASVVGKVITPKEEQKLTNDLKDRLSEKAKKLDRASRFERITREEEVARAEAEGNPLSAIEVLKLRKVEELKRLEAYKQILRERQLTR